jgi:hypothetical protein
MIMHYESTDTVLSFDNTSYLNFLGKLTKQLFVGVFRNSLPSGLWPPHLRDL